MKGTMKEKKNIGRPANDAADAIIREIGEKHFREPPAGAFTIFDVARQFAGVGEHIIRARLNQEVKRGMLQSGRFGYKRFYWRAAK